MKSSIVVLAAVMVSSVAHGQGQFYFNNRIGTEVNARFITTNDPRDGSSSSIGSPDWTVQLLGGPAPFGQPEVALVPAGTTFLGPAGSSDAGYVVGVTVTVPNVPVGGDAVIRTGIVGPGFRYDFLTEIHGLGGGTATLPNLQLGTTPLLVFVPDPNVPEPTTLALSALGVGALWVGHRRSRRHS